MSLIETTGIPEVNDKGTNEVQRLRTALEASDKDQDITLAGELDDQITEASKKLGQRYSLKLLFDYFRFEVWRRDVEGGKYQFHPFSDYYFESAKNNQALQPLSLEQKVSYATGRYKQLLKVYGPLPIKTDHGKTTVENIIKVEIDSVPIKGIAKHIKALDTIVVLVIRDKYTKDPDNYVYKVGNTELFEQLVGSGDSDSDSESDDVDTEADDKKKQDEQNKVEAQQKKEREAAEARRLKQQQDDDDEEEEERKRDAATKKKKDDAASKSQKPIDITHKGGGKKPADTTVPVVIPVTIEDKIAKYTVNKHFIALYKLCGLLEKAGDYVNFENWSIHKLLNTFNVVHCLEIHGTKKAIKDIYARMDDGIVYRLVVVRLTSDKGLQFKFGSMGKELVTKSLNEMTKILSLYQDAIDIGGYKGESGDTYIDYRETYPLIGVVAWTGSRGVLSDTRRFDASSGLITTITPEIHHATRLTTVEEFNAEPSLVLTINDAEMLQKFYLGDERAGLLERVLNDRSNDWFHAFDCIYVDIEQWDSLMKEIGAKYKKYLPSRAAPSERSEKAHMKEGKSAITAVRECTDNFEKLKIRFAGAGSKIVSLKSAKKEVKAQYRELYSLLQEIAMDETAVVPFDTLDKLSELFSRDRGFKSSVINGSVVNMDTIFEMDQAKEKLMQSLFKGPYSMNLRVRHQVDDSFGERSDNTNTNTPVLDLTVNHVNTIELNEKSVVATALNNSVTKSYKTTLGMAKKNIIPSSGVMSIQVKNGETGIVETRDIAYNIDTNGEGPIRTLRANGTRILMKSVDADHLELKMLIVDM